MLDVIINLNDKSISIMNVYSGPLKDWDVQSLIKRREKLFRISYYGLSIISIKQSDAILHRAISANKSILFNNSVLNPETVLFINKSLISEYRNYIKDSGGVILYEMLAESKDVKFPDDWYKVLDDNSLYRYLVEIIKRRALAISCIMFCIISFSIYTSHELKRTNQSLSIMLHETHKKLEQVEDGMATNELFKKLQKEQIKYPVSYIIDRLALVTGNDVKYKEIKIDKQKIILSGIFSNSESLEILTSQINEETFIFKIEISDIKHMSENNAKFESTLWLKH